MTYYLLLPERLLEAENNLHSDRYELGESSFGTFYPSQGYHLLEDLAERFPDVLSDVKVMTDQNEELSVEEFLEEIDEMTVLR
jgi:hypothetical protein